MFYTLLAAATTAGTTAAGTPEQVGTTGAFASMAIWIVALFVILYFFMIRPQKKKEKEAKALRDSLQIGDEVTTIGGITGIIVRKTEDTVVIETGGDRSKIRVKLWAISENATIHDEVEQSVKVKKSKKNASDETESE